MNIALAEGCAVGPPCTAGLAYWLPDERLHPPLQVKWLGLADYQSTLEAMRQFCASRDAHTSDQIWWLEHPPVFTLGISGGHQHLRDPGEIPVVQTDRGGQITYHGPGQLILYPLLDLRRLGIGVRQLIVALENAVIATVKRWGIEAHSRRDAPGVYVGSRKLASIGLRLQRHYTYHGIALNVHNNLAPFKCINPCGYEGLEMTRVADLGGPSGIPEVAHVAVCELVRILNLPAVAEVKVGQRIPIMNHSRRKPSLRSPVHHHLSQLI